MNRTRFSAWFAAGTLWILTLSASEQLPVVCADEDLSVLPAATSAGPTKGSFSRYLMGEAFAALDRRQADYEKIKTPEDALAYHQRMKATFIQHLGGFPERTPLRAETVGTLDGDGYRIEKVIYESQPQHHVTAILYLPKSPPPYPAVVIPCGHSSTGKAAQQPMCILLARYGIAALSYDPIGQAERIQILNEDGKPKFKMTTEHTVIGAGCIPVGRNTATYRIWDGMRSIDYLQSRPEIDPSKIGVTGCSGGGTLSSYLMALDDRILCAAPSCYITSWRRLLETIGPQDAEQNIHGQIGYGLDHADFLMIRAPRPTLILASTRDFFDIQGTWQSFRQAKRFYTRLGYAERVGIVETDAKHGYPKLQREAMVRWMRRWLLDIDEPVAEPEFNTLAAKELQCTPKGQVLQMPDERSVIDLNVQLAAQWSAARQLRWKPENRLASLDEVATLAGIRPLDKLPKATVNKHGALKRVGFRIEKLELAGDTSVPLPALLFVPDKQIGQRLLYLSGKGKQDAARKDGPIEKLVLQGNLVLAVDLRGLGETGSGAGGMWGGN